MNFNLLFLGCTDCFLQTSVYQFFFIFSNFYFVCLFTRSLLHCLSASENLNAAPLMQYLGSRADKLRPRGSVSGAVDSSMGGTVVTSGPSMNTCPRWLLQHAHWHSTRPSISRRRMTDPSLAVLQNDGQPEPESNLPFDSKSFWPQ